MTAGLILCQTGGWAQTGEKKICEEVVSLDRKRGLALQKKDYRFLNEVYVHDWTYITDSGILIDRAEYFSLIKSIEYRKIEYEYLNSRCYNGDTVVINLVNRIETVFLGKEEKKELLCTRIYVKEDGYWKFAAQHAAKMAVK